MSRGLTSNKNALMDATEMRGAADAAFTKISEGRDKISEQSLKKLLKEVGFRATNHHICQSLPILSDGSRSITRQGFIDWCIRVKSVGDGAKLNRLLIRYVIGTTRDTSYNLPGRDFIFGKPGNDKAESAGDVIFDWKVGKRSKKKREGTNIIYENKQANIAGCLTVKQANQWRDNYRAEKAIRLKKLAEETKRKEAAGEVTKVVVGENGEVRKKMPWEENDLAFGKLSKPSEPTSTLLSSEFAKDAEPRYTNVSGQIKSGKLPLARPTNNSILLEQSSRRKLAQTTTKGPFKLKKFQNVSSKFLDY
jgi:hypothetical protein|eukprot:g4847.t1